MYIELYHHLKSHPSPCIGYEKYVIPKSLQLVASRTAQEFNKRKSRKGAFWEDRYHATAVETDDHLAQCLVYIDLNMVRAGVVSHPSEYRWSGYNEILNPPKRYGLINLQILQKFFLLASETQFRKEYEQWVETELRRGRLSRIRHWSEAIAVGGERFVQNIQHQLKSRAGAKAVESVPDAFALKEEQASYNTHFRAKMRALTAENSYFIRLNQ